MALFLFALLAGISLSAAVAANYPSRPIRLIVGFTPGGPSDILARVIGQWLQERMGQPVIIDNRPGAGGNIAAEAAAEAAGDGHTLLMGNNSILATNPSLYRRVGYDPLRDFVPVTLIGAQPNILVVHPSVPARSVAELVALAKAQSGHLNFASSGYGAAAHLAGELFKKQASIDIVHVAYKGAAPALTDLVSGQVQMMFATAAAVMPFIKSGMLRPLAVTTLNRSAVAPDLPTMGQAGFAGFEATTWHGIVVPKNTPTDIVARLHDEVVAGLHQPDIERKLGELGIEIVGDTPEEFARYIRTEIPKWSRVIEDAGARVER